VETSRTGYFWQGDSALSAGRRISTSNFDFKMVDDNTNGSIIRADSYRTLIPPAFGAQFILNAADEGGS